MKRLLSYVTNEKKTEKTLVTGLNCSANASEAYEDMKFGFEMFSGERFFKMSIKSETAKSEKQKIRLHHYIQSFKPGEVTPDEAHQIGVEWAERAFGKKAVVLCATHTDRGHIHNHFAVCPYDMDGKHWHANKESLRRCKAISDEIALAHGLEIIEHPKKSYNHKYGEYKMRKEGKSWKQKLCDDIDDAIMKDSVRNVDDLLKELQKQGYGIRRGKYISIKVRQNRKPIRSYRLGDGYALEHLQFRIEHKNMEMPMSEALKYSGIQREYALCIRQIQIQLYRCPEPERLHIATYREIERSSRLLFYLRDSKIHSADDFRKAVSDAEARLKNLKAEKDSLTKKIADEEKLIGDIPKYLETLKRRPLLPKDISELAKYNYLKDAGITSLEDAKKHRLMLDDMKSRLEEADGKIREAVSEKKAASDFYTVYENQMKSDYQILLEQAKAEMGNIRREEERQKAEKERSDLQAENKPQGRGKSGFSI
jgi:hypothetical protein